MQTIYFIASILRFGCFALLLAPVASQYWHKGDQTGAVVMIVIAGVQLLALRGLRPGPVPRGSNFGIFLDVLMVPGAIFLAASSVTEIETQIFRFLAMMNASLYGLANLVRASLMIRERVLASRQG